MAFSEANPFPVKTPSLCKIKIKIPMHLGKRVARMEHFFYKNKIKNCLLFWQEIIEKNLKNQFAVAAD
jgi:hypothetical protein